MSELNLSSATTTNLSSAVPDFIVAAKALDYASSGSTYTYKYFDKAPEYFGYYFSIPEVYSAANALATWAINRGWKAKDIQTKVDLDHVTGDGKDNFTSISYQHTIVTAIVGDAFIQCKRSDTGRLVNMIAISPERVRVAYAKDGLLHHYDVWNGTEWKEVKKEEMLHSRNKKIADSLGGTSQLLAAKKIIDARNEALDDERIIKHRDKALGIAYYETDKAGKISYANSQIEQAVAKGEMVGLPKDTVKIEPWPSRSSEDRTQWIQYLENFFYQIFGVPRSIASSDGTSEVGGKMGHVIFEPVYTKVQVDYEADLWTQQQISVKFNRPPSLGGLVQEEEAKNTGQTNIQPNDSVVNMNRE